MVVVHKYTCFAGDVLSDSRVTTFVNDPNNNNNNNNDNDVAPNGDADGDVSTYENPFTSYNKGNKGLEESFLKNDRAQRCPTHLPFPTCGEWNFNELIKVILILD